MCVWCRYTQRPFERTHGPPSPNTQTHTLNTTPTQHHSDTDRERGRKKTERERRQKKREETTRGGGKEEEREEKGKTAFFTGIRGGMYMSATLFLFIFSRGNAIWNTFHDVCFSKPLTFHNGFMIFLLLIAVSNTYRDFKLHLFGTKIGLEICKNCLKQLRKAKNMKPLEKVKGFEQQTSWTVSVPDCFLHQVMSKNSDAEMYIFLHFYTVILSVCDTPQPHTQPNTQNQTHQQNTNTHPHIAHTHTLHIPTLTLHTTHTPHPT